MRASLRTSAIVIAGAAVLALAANGVSYAATGQGLIGGQHNTVGKTTTIKTTGAGPALSLSSRGNKLPSLSVSSKAQVKNLNASLLGGQTADSLASRAQKFFGGRSGDELSTDAFRLPVKPGAYSIALQGAFFADDAEEPGTVECIVIDGSFQKLYAGAVSAYDPDNTTVLPSAANVVNITKGGVFLECFASTDGVEYGVPVTVSFTPVNSVSAKPATPISVPTMKRAPYGH